LYYRGMVANKEVPQMSAAERWLKAAERDYLGESEGPMLDRAMRVKGDADRVLMALFSLHELRAIRQLLEGLVARLKNEG